MYKCTCCAYACASTLCLRKHTCCACACACASSLPLCKCVRCVWACTRAPLLCRRLCKQPAPVQVRTLCVGVHASAPAVTVPMQAACPCASACCVWHASAPAMRPPTGPTGARYTCMQMPCAFHVHANACVTVPRLSLCAWVAAAVRTAAECTVRLLDSCKAPCVPQKVGSRSQHAWRALVWQRLSGHRACTDVAAPHIAALEYCRMHMIPHPTLPH